jgi:pimeloyl-ACP methyl ester carboxylesterase
MTEKKIFINDLKINYKIAGKGAFVLILHGWGASSDSWIKVQKILAKNDFLVICPDFPGFGKSLTPKNPWSLKDYSDFVLDFLENLKIGEPFFLLGHSFGGRVAIKFVVNFPEKVKKLILVNSAGIKQKLTKKEKIIFWLAKIGNALFTPKILVRFKDKARNFFYLFLRHRDYVKANGTMKETIKKILNEDLLPDLPKVKTPTLILWGKRDKLVPVKYAYVFKENIKDSKLKIFSKIGHSPHLEIPEKLAQVISQFFKEP